ncbi:class I SAM-dependent methyltransferase [Vibrio hepatarius]|uniref:class I SAM-dependent methyltransferase n=1 Tax=Vibrio hepatarius TaxID=171383 RepID=UPI001C08B085|nr:methyltransferase domain-containing protein [Vibrio hepatarius]MBU2898488.1 class I SAM-dependent methyltransferase [Vibrio hepatarius]
MNYDREYYSNGIVQFDAAKELLQLLPKRVDSLLDVGCGSGKVSHLIYEHLSPKFMLAIDNSLEMINQATLRYPDSKLQFLHADINQFGLENRFEVVTANSSFQWFRDYDASLLAIKNALKPSGIFVMQTPYKQDWCPQVSALMDKFFTDYYPEHGHCFTLPCMHLDSPEEYIRLFESKGFSTVSIKTHHFEYQFSGNEFKKFFMSGAYKVYTQVNSYSLAIPNQLKGDLESFICEYTLLNKTFEVSMTRVIASFKPAFYV